LLFILSDISPNGFHWRNSRPWSNAADIEPGCFQKGLSANVVLSAGAGIVIVQHPPPPNPLPPVEGEYTPLSRGDVPSPLRGRVRVGVNYYFLPILTSK
jgi:hypothetical protein